MMGLGRTALLLYFFLAPVNTEPLEKSYQTGILAFSEWDLNHDCIVTYEEFKNWVLDMLMTVIKFQALVEADKPGTKSYEEGTYEQMMRRVIDNLGMLSNHNANVNTIMAHYLNRLEKKLKAYEKDKISRIFKFNSRLNLTFWYNL